MSTLMSQADYARHRGVSKQAVNKAVKAGKIVLRAGKVDAAEADLALGADVARVNYAPVQAERPAGGFASPSQGLTQARTATEVYNARLAQLKYEREIGKVLDVADVTAAAAACAEALVRMLDRLPQRADDLCAAARSDEGASAVRALLRDYVREVRRATADEFSKLPAAAVAAPAEPVA